MNQTRDFGFDQVNISFLDSKKTLPLIISPRWDDSLDFICKWLENNRPWVDQQILNYGAVLIRGFQVNSAPDFEKATLALQPDLSDAYRGTSPRTVKPGTKYAFSAADVPVNYPIAQHCEMSFLKSPPRQLYFGCMKASNREGGETALCDFRKVLVDLPPDLREKFATKKLKYTRKHHKVGEKWTYDVGAMLGWPKLFGTSDPKRVEDICREEDAPKITWLGQDHDAFLQEWIDEPFQRHPVTNELVWFNHTQVFHWTTFPMELWFAFTRFRDLQLFIHFVLISIFTFIKYGLLGYKMALNTEFGDGTPISFQEMNHVREAVHKNLVFSRWQKGDILAIDNFSTSHGRQPTYDKGRDIAVAWSHPFDKTQIPLDAPVVMQKIDATSESIPDLAHSPDSSPESTMTQEQAAKLKESVISGKFEDQMDAAFKKQRFHKRLTSCPDLIHSSSEFWTRS